MYWLSSFWNTFFSLSYLNGNTYDWKLTFGGICYKPIWRYFGVFIFKLYQFILDLICFWTKVIWAKELILQDDSIQIICVYYWPHKCNLTQNCIAWPTSLPYLLKPLLLFFFISCYWAVLTMELSTITEMFDPAQYSVVATSYMWLLRIWNVAGTTKEVNF